MQGDVEKAQGKPASFLCDRETVKVAKEQPGFITFVVIPVWGLVDNVFPGMTEATQRAEYNIINWKNHEETEEE